MKGRKTYGRWLYQVLHRAFSYARGEALRPVAAHQFKEQGEIRDLADFHSVALRPNRGRDVEVHQIGIGRSGDRLWIQANRRGDLIPSARLAVEPEPGAVNVQGAEADFPPRLQFRLGRREQVGDHLLFDQVSESLVVCDVSREFKVEPLA